MNSSKLTFEAIHEGLPGVTADTCRSYVTSACVCLKAHNHSQPVELTVEGIVEDRHELIWTHPTDQALRENEDLSEAAENGALAIAFITALAFTSYTVVKRSRKYTGFDWLLGHQGQDLQGAARLEVSGLHSGNDSQYRTRCKKKLAQSTPSDSGGLPAYASVTNFIKPITRLAKRDV